MIRIFQNMGVYPSYRYLFDKANGTTQEFRDRIQAFIDDRFGAPHLLEPVLTGSQEAFFTNGDDELLQRSWARANGMTSKCSLEDILLAQIEHHKTEVFYNMDPMRYGSGFIGKLPGCVRRSFAWRAAPSPGADFSAYDLVLCNFHDILKSYEERGWRAAYFSPAHDPAMDAFAARNERPVDVIFVGTYSRHHRRRAALLEAVSDLADEFNVRFHLDSSRMTRLAESPIGLLSPIRRHRRPRSIRSIASNPVFGLDLYDALGSAKIVLNGAIDMAGHDKGNMRCFEAMGCGAAMVSDAGNYPTGMADDVNMITYATPLEAVQHIRTLLLNEDLRNRIAQNGYKLMTTSYSKSEQWNAFMALVEMS